MAGPHTNDLELGVNNGLQQNIARHQAATKPKPISQRRLNFEAKRPRVLLECIAEATGVFFYVFPGIASVASFTLHGKTALGVTAFGSLFQIGWAFAIGVAISIITCGPISGGHFNPAITICFALWQSFSWKKVPHYILSQIFGAFVAGLLVMGVYWPQIHAFAAQNIAKHGTAIYNGGAASIFCPFPNPEQTNLGYIFFLEFFVDSFVGTVVWACLDPSNPFVSPTSVPFTIGLAYATMIWGFAANSISTNLARDLGTRIVAAIFFGREAFGYMDYCWIALLVNVPATVAGTAYYEFVMKDSLRSVQDGCGRCEAGWELNTIRVSKKGRRGGDQSRNESQNWDEDGNGNENENRKLETST